MSPFGDYKSVSFVSFSISTYYGSVGIFSFVPGLIDNNLSLETRWLVNLVLGDPTKLLIYDELCTEYWSNSCPTENF